jgi:hypothetical protein
MILDLHILFLWMHILFLWMKSRPILRVLVHFAVANLAEIEAHVTEGRFSPFLTYAMNTHLISLSFVAHQGRPAGKGACGGSGGLRGGVLLLFRTNTH